MTITFTLRSNHRINGILYPRGKNELEPTPENFVMAANLVQADRRAAPELSYCCNMSLTESDGIMEKKIPEPDPGYIKRPSSSGNLDVK